MEPARAAGEILSGIDPDFASALTLMLIPGTPLFEEYERCEFEIPDKMEMLREMREIVVHMDVSHCPLFIQSCIKLSSYSCCVSGSETRGP